MSLRLTAANLLVRGPVMIRWLELVDHMVYSSLAAIMADLPTRAPVDLEGVPRGAVRYRRAMAERHARMVDALIEDLGREAGVREGRRAMREAGLALGKRLRSELDLSDGMEDLFAAAKLLYRVLGIEFQVAREGEGARMTVHRCSLSEHYSELTCKVMSAMDEGVVMGLSPKAAMAFTRCNSGGERPCEAVITWEAVR